MHMLVSISYLYTYHTFCINLYPNKSVEHKPKKNSNDSKGAKEGLKKWPSRKGRIKMKLFKTCKHMKGPQTKLGKANVSKSQPES